MPIWLYALYTEYLSMDVLICIDSLQQSKFWHLKCAYIETKKAPVITGAFQIPIFLIR
ncbi:hypothetical protein SAMN05428949_1817 [Chitinophaga sp. YR627]|nr:hypothetical protein SAMN05428949_1817 [Chitinophaga sp. YR627]